MQQSEHQEGKYRREAEIVFDQLNAVVLIRTYDEDNNQVFAYVAVKMTELEKLRTALDSETFKLSEVGEVIEAGFGDPDQETMEYMEKNYNFDHKNVLVVPQKPEG